VGTTWLHRGRDYWLRRATAALLLLVGVVVLGAMLVALLLWIHGQSEGAFAGACVVLGAVMTFTGVRTWNRRPPPPGDVRAARRALRRSRMIATYGGLATVILFLLAAAATQLFQAVAFVFLAGFAAAAAGPYFVFFWRSLGRELPAEEQLRAGLGLPAPGDADRAGAVDRFVRDAATRH
jgi:hypothetical protein